MELMWKAVAVILNHRFTASITYHDYLNGFRAGRGMGTATLEVKLPQQVSALREAVLHAIFLDLHKSYDALDRSRCLEPIEVVMVGDGGGEAVIKNHRHRLPHQLHKTYNYSTLVTPPFRYQDHCLSGRSLCESSFPECHLDKLHHYLLFSLRPPLLPFLSPILGSSPPPP